MLLKRQPQKKQEPIARESVEDQESGEYTGALGSGQIEKQEDGTFVATCQVDKDTITPNPFKSFSAAEGWILKTLEGK